MKVRFEVLKVRRSTLFDWFVKQAQTFKTYRITISEGQEVHSVEVAIYEEVKRIWELIKGWKGVLIYMNDKPVSAHRLWSFLSCNEWNTNADRQNEASVKEGKQPLFSYVGICPKCSANYRSTPDLWINGSVVIPADAKCPFCGHDLQVIDAEEVDSQQPRELPPPE